MRAAVAGSVLTLILASMFMGCPPAAAPTGSCVNRVVQDALSGMTVDAIVKDAGLGCVTDVEEVMAILLGAQLKVPAVTGTKAFAEASAHYPPSLMDSTGGHR